MPELTKFESSVYIAIEELISIRPDGELTYTKILACYLNGTANKDIPWIAIQKSKVYGKFPKSNILSVMMACNKLTEMGLLEKIKVGNNYKYFKTLRHLETNSQPKLFSEQIDKYKKYLLETFVTCIIKYCPSIKPTEHENYYAFMNGNPLHLSEYSWFYLTDKSNEPNSLKLSIRYRPNMKSVAFKYTLSYSSFYHVVDEVVGILDNEKTKYKLNINRHIELPLLQAPTNTNKKSLKINGNTTVDVSFFNDYGENNIFINDGGNDSTNTALSVSESSPYKYCGDTIFLPKELQKIIKGKQNFDFSFLKWKMVAWTMSKQESLFIQNVLLIDKKEKKFWVFLSIPKRKVLCITTNNFNIKNDNEEITSLDLLKKFFK